MTIIMKLLAIMAQLVFLNIEAKYGGHYLPENNKWAKQTIAHNTVVLNESSQFNGDWHESQKIAPEILFLKRVI